MSLPKSLLFNHSCMYDKRGGVAAYHIVWIGLCLSSVPGVRVFANAVDINKITLLHKVGISNYFILIRIYSHYRP